MSIKITTTDKSGNKIVTEYPNNVLSGYTISSTDGVYKTKDGPPKKGSVKPEIPPELIPDQIEITAEPVSTEGKFLSLFKWLFKYVNKKNNSKR